MGGYLLYRLCCELHSLEGDLDVCPVGSELQAYAEVVLHAAHLSAECDSVLGESVERGLELVAVYFELLAEADPDGLWFACDQVWMDVNAAFAEHGR